MASYSSDFYFGPMFEVIAGLDHKCYLVHASILNKSDKLKAIMEGDWKESAERKVVLEDWDEGTVERLVAWLYTGDYSSPLPRKLVDNIAVVDSGMPLGGQQIISVAPPIDEALSTPEITQQGIALDQADKDFAKQIYTSSTEYIDRWLKCCKHYPHELNFEARLLAHAKVYCIANYLLLADLQALAFQHLRSVLAWIDSRIISKSLTVSNLVTLIRYVYANTNRPNIGEEPLQKLLTTLVAINFGSFSDGEKGEVRRLMNEGGDFGTDVWEKVSRHVGGLQKELKESKGTIARLENPPFSSMKKARLGW